MKQIIILKYQDCLHNILFKVGTFTKYGGQKQVSVNYDTVMQGMSITRFSSNT